MTHAGARPMDRFLFRVELLLGMVKRDVLGRYRSSHFGIVWALLSPLLMLAVYTFAFHELMGARWPGASSRQGFASMVFVGMIIHGLFAECLARSPMSIAGNPNYVKKVVFPLVTLPLVPILSAVFHAAMALIVLGVITVVGGGSMTWTAIFVPIVLAPYVVLLAGLSWMLSAMGVYIRDITQFSVMVSTALLFLSPVFYPAKAIPGKYAFLAYLNPIAFIIEQTRSVLFMGRTPDWAMLGLYSLVAIVIAAVGLSMFEKLKRGFADVL